MRQRIPVQLVTLASCRVPRKLQQSTRAQQDVPLCVALVVNFASSMGVARGHSIPFIVGDQGCAAHQREQDLLDLDGDEHPHGHQSQTAVFAYSVFQPKEVCKV